MRRGNLCVTVDDKIRELAGKLGESPQVTSDLVGLWRELDVERREDLYPDPASLRMFRDYVRESESDRFEKNDGITPLQKIDLDFTPDKRRDRSSLLSKLFSLEVDSKLEEARREMRERIERETNSSRKFELEESLSGLDRRAIISLGKGPVEIFEAIERTFQEYVNSTIEERIEMEKMNYEGAPLSEEEITERAREDAEYKTVEYNKILDNFMALADEASTTLLFTEGVRIDPRKEVAEEANFNESDEMGDSSLDDQSDDYSKEETIREGWMQNYMFISAHESLSTRVRKIINQVPKTDSEGYVEVDDLGYDRYLDPSYVHAALIDGLRYMTSSSEMMDLLENLARRKPWVSGIMELLANDETLFSQFYMDFRKDFIPYWIERTITNSDGTVSVKTIPVNLPESTYYLLDEWRDNIMTGTQLSSNSIYNTTRDLNSSQAKINRESVNELINKYNQSQDKESFLSTDETKEALGDLLKSVGINPNMSLLADSLSEKGAFHTLTSNLNTIFKGVQSGFNGDLLTEYKSAYSNMATLIGSITDDAIESSSRENGKTYYGHTNPSYFGKMFNKLKNVTKDSKSFDEFIQKEFKSYSWFFKKGKWRSDWVKQLAEDPKAREMLQHKVLLNVDRVNYSDMTSKEYALTLLREYSSDPVKDAAWYHVPIMSDAPIARFIRFKKYTGTSLDENNKMVNYKDILAEKYMDLVNQEIDRINLVVKRDKARRAGKKGYEAIDNYDIKRNKKGEITSLGGAEFKFLPGLNSLRTEDGKTFLEKVKELSAKNSSALDLNKFIKESIIEVVDTAADDMMREWNKKGVFEKAREIAKGANEDNIAYKHFPRFKKKSDLVNYMREYYWNSSFATSQIIQITTTDLAYYKNMEDFQKRFKQINSPAQRLNILATFEGVRVGKPYEKTAYLKDNKITSTAIEDIEKVLDMKVKDGTITKLDRDAIRSKYRVKDGKDGINQTDAQALRSLKSYRELSVMAGTWTKDSERAYNNFLNNTWDMQDFWTLWQPIKPFVYTQTRVNSGIDGDIKVPVQHKNSEFVLMAIHSMVASSLGKSSKLKAINQFMVDNEIDVIQFESAVKVGGQGQININGVESYNDVYDSLMEQTGLKEGVENPNVVHQIDYEDYGIQVATPEHSIDATQLVGTQLRKLITADMDGKIEIKIGDEVKTKEEWLSLYNQINTENILQSFIACNKGFMTVQEVEKILLEEVRSNAKYGPELIKACSLDENGHFRIPLYDEVQSNRVQSMLNSIIKDRITKQRIKGGSCIQVSNFGLTDELNIVFNEDGGIKYMECYMPWYTRKYLEPLMKEGSHELDINKVPEDLRKLIGYRIPTEDKYSMAPLFIKGFLPQQSGGAIMLPSDITTISGSDFDVDKLYLMIPEFRIDNRIDEGKMISDMLRTYKGNDKKKAAENIRVVFDQMKAGQEFSEGSFEMRVHDWYEANKENYRKNEIKKIQYDFSKTPKENGTQARNNLMIDLIWGVLTNKDTAFQILNPGGFDPQKKAARISTILNSGVQRRTLEARIGSKDILETLKSLSMDELDQIIDDFRTPIDPLSPATQVNFHQQNMTGARMISIFANHNANHALAQQLKHFGVSEKYGAFKLFGKTYTELNAVKNKKGEYISRNNAGYLAASVDNVKDPVLAAMNLNPFTSDVSMLLSRLGYDPFEVALVLNQPIVKEMTDRYNMNARLGADKKLIVADVVKEWSKFLAGKEPTFNQVKDLPFEADDLINDILISNNLEENNVDEYFKSQIYFGTLFKRIMETADALGSFVRATRADSQNGGAGPQISSTIIKLQTVQDFMEDAQRDDFPLTGAHAIDVDIVYEGDENKIRKEIMESKLPILQAFYTFGLKQTSEMMGKYFPHYNDDFQQVVDILRSYTRIGKLNQRTLNNVYSDLFAYIMNKTQFFGNDGRMSAAEKRNYYVNNFPNDFKQIVASNPDIAELDFIKRLVVGPIDKGSALKIISFRNVGKLSTQLKEKYSRDWASLLYMNNPVANRLALELFAYNYYRNGFAFGPNSFIHLAPNVVREAIPGYISTLRDIMTTPDDYRQFADQYVLNHLNNKKLVPESEVGTNPFIVKDKFADRVEINSLEDTADKKMVKMYVTKNGRNTPVFFEFIAKTDGKNTAYYRLDNSIEGKTFYDKVNPLGLLNNVLEYQYGEDAVNIESQVKDIPVDFAKSADMINFDNMEDEMDYDRGAYSDEALESELSRYESGSEGRLEDSPWSISPNEEFRDADNKPLCK